MNIRDKENRHKSKEHNQAYHSKTTEKQIKKKNSKANQRKIYITIQKAPTRLTADFSTETTEVKK